MVWSYPIQPCGPIVEFSFKLKQTNYDGFSVVLRMMSDVFRCSIAVFRCSVDVFRCCKDVFRCCKDVFRCFQIFSSGYRYSLDILRCVQDVFSRSRMWNRINSQDVEKRKIANISCAMILISLTDSIHPTFTFLNSIHCHLKCNNTRLCQFRN